MSGFIPRSVKILTFASLMVICVALAVPSQAADGERFYSIFVESFATAESAAKRVHTLKNSGYDAFVRYQSTPADRRSYRVYLGRFNDKLTARNRLKSLINSNLSEYLAIVRLPDLGPQEMPSNYLDPQTASLFAATETMPKTPVASDSQPESQSSQDAKYFLHVGSYLNYDDMSYEIERLKEHDLDPFWIRGFDHNLIWFRIYLGSYPDLAGAQKAGDRLIQKKIIPLYTVDNTPSIKAPQFVDEEKQEQQGATDRIPMSNPPPPAPEEGYLREMAKNDAQGPGVDLSGPLSASSHAVEAVKYADDALFSIGIRASQYRLPGMDEFTITQNSYNMTTYWYIDGEYAVGIALPVSLRINRFLSLEGCPELADSGVLETFFLSLRPKLTYPLPNGLESFFSVGVLHGSFNWEGTPGDFDNGVGWNTGLGLSYLQSRFKFSAEAAYRRIKFNYNPPDDSVVSSGSRIDFSGYSFSISVEYLF